MDYSVPLIVFGGAILTAFLALSIVTMMQAIGIQATIVIWSVAIVATIAAIAFALGIAITVEDGHA